MYLRQLKRLLARFQFAPNNTEDLDVYMGDLKLLLQYTKDWLRLGWRTAFWLNSNRISQLSPLPVLGAPSASVEYTPSKVEFLSTDTNFMS
jgi:hypothetical protein